MQCVIYLITYNQIVKELKTYIATLSKKRSYIDPRYGGASRDRTDDLIRARDALSQLSYGPTKGWVDYQKV